MKPVPGIVSAVLKGSQVLLLKRNKEPFAGLWALPGGKIEFGEHICEAAVREIKEETNLDTGFENFRGVVSEHVRENGNVRHHFLLFVCTLRFRGGVPVSGPEGELEWFNLNELDGIKEGLVPSDYFILKEMVLKKGESHYKSIIEKTGDRYRQKVFECL